MDEYVKKESKTYIIHADSNKEDIPEVDEQDVDVEQADETKKEENSIIPEPPKKIEVINGKGKDLTISGVSEYLEVQKPKEEKKGDIIIPQEKNK